MLERPGAEPQLHVQSLVSGGTRKAGEEGTTETVETVALLGGRRVWTGGRVQFAIARASQRELVVEVRRGGRPCTSPVVKLLEKEGYQGW